MENDKQNNSSDKDYIFYSSDKDYIFWALAGGIMGFCYANFYRFAIFLDNTYWILALLLVIFALIFFLVSILFFLWFIMFLLIQTVYSFIILIDLIRNNFCYDNLYEDRNSIFDSTALLYSFIICFLVFFNRSHNDYGNIANIYNFIIQNFVFFGLIFFFELIPLISIVRSIYLKNLSETKKIKRFFTDFKIFSKKHSEIAKPIFDKIQKEIALIELKIEMDRLIELARLQCQQKMLEIKMQQAKRESDEKNLFAESIIEFEKLIQKHSSILDKNKMSDLKNIFKESLKQSFVDNKK